MFAYTGGIQGIQGVPGEDGTLLWHDRGDIAAFDYTQATITLNGGWYELDLSGIVGSQACLVLLILEINSHAANDYVQFKTFGNSNTKNTSLQRFQVATEYDARDIWIYTNAAGKVEHFGDIEVGANYTLTVRGWYE